MDMTDIVPNHLVLDELAYFHSLAEHSKWWDTVHAVYLVVGAFSLAVGVHNSLHLENAIENKGISEVHVREVGECLVDLL